MRWIKKGLIFKPDNTLDWMAHHASIPVADKISDEAIRIYFSPRDSQNHSRIGIIDVEADNPQNILRVYETPALSLGELGAFDDDGVMPSDVVTVDGKKHMYYIGWNRGVTVAYRNATGLAVSNDSGLTFERMYRGPILERYLFEPHFAVTPFVMIDDGVWKMWYSSTTRFVMINDYPEPQYQVKYAESKDGIHWERRENPCLPYAVDGEASARPSVIKENGIYRMWYCFRNIVDYRTDRSQSYRIGYAESPDGINWTRKDDEVGIDRSETDWDSEMMAYPYVYTHKGKKHMLYVGNGFGSAGFGYAVLEE